MHIYAYTYIIRYTIRVQETLGTFIFELSGFGEQRWLPRDFSSVICLH